MSESALRAAFAQQARACADLGSPFMARLMALFAERPWPEGPVVDRLRAWPGDLTAAGQNVPLRLAGALHGLRLAGDPGLAEVYPPARADAGALWAAVCGAILGDPDEIGRWLSSPPQTNEVRRAAVLIAAGHWLARRFGLPLTLSEMGASAGLNLMWDRFALQAGPRRLGPADPALTLAPDWQGDLPEAGDAVIVERRGVDLNPLSPQADAARLLAYLWPDQPERLALTRAALAVADAPVDRGDAADWIAGRLAPGEGTAHLVYTTIAFQYFPPESQARIDALIAAAGAAATEAAPLARLAMENDGGRGAALDLTTWPGGESRSLGRADFHGRWVAWRSP